MIFLIYPALLMISGSVLIDSQNLDTNNCTKESISEVMRIELCAQRELIGLWGEDVILPCLFNHSERNTIKDVHLLLYKTKRSTENILYNSSSNYTHESFKGRVQSVGNPSEGDWSVRIRDLKMEDEGTFMCRFEWRKANGDKVGFQIRDGKEPTLHVEMRPQILRIGRRFVNSRTSWRLLCEAEAKPGPNITWWNPQGLILNESQVLIDQDDPNKVQTIISTLNITKKELEGRYWCLAQNKHGTAKEHIDFCETPVQEVSWMIIIWSTSLWVVVLLFGVGLFFCTKSWKHQGVRQGQRRTSNVQEPDQSDENTYTAVSKEDHSDDNTYTAVPNTFSISEDQVYENI